MSPKIVKWATKEAVKNSQMRPPSGIFIFLTAFIEGLSPSFESFISFIIAFLKKNSQRPIKLCLLILFGVYKLLNLLKSKLIKFI